MDLSAMLSRQAERHREIFLARLKDATEVTVRQPAAKPSTTGNDMTKALGSRGQVTGVGPETMVPALVQMPHGTGMPTAAFPSATSALGQLANSDIILVVDITKVLLDQSKPHGKTLFDTAKDVVVQGSTYKVDGSVRGGLTPLPPYALWVGLKLIG